MIVFAISILSLLAFAVFCASVDWILAAVFVIGVVIFIMTVTFGYQAPPNGK